MAYPFASSSELFTQSNLIATLRRTFGDLPDARRPGGNTRYAMEDAALSAFSVFFMQSPSFLAWQRSMQESQGRNNAQSLFGVYLIPSDTQIRNLLDTVSPDHFYPVFRHVCKGLEPTDHLNAFRALEGSLLLALDGTEYFSSTPIHCECCSSQRLKNGPTRYFHGAVTPVIVAPIQRPSSLPRRMARTSRTASWPRPNAGSRGKLVIFRRPSRYWAMIGTAISRFVNRCAGGAGILF